MEQPVQAGRSKADVRRLLRLRVPVVVKLAGKKLTVHGITGWHVGTILEFDKRAEQELELMIRNKTIGFGEAVKTGEKFGLRVNSICDIRETIRSLGDAVIDPGGHVQHPEQG